MVADLNEFVKPQLPTLAILLKNFGLYFLQICYDNKNIFKENFMKNLKVLAVFVLLAISNQAIAKPIEIQFKKKGDYCKYFEAATDESFSIFLKEKQPLSFQIYTNTTIKILIKDPKGKLLRIIDNNQEHFPTIRLYKSTTKGQYHFSFATKDNELAWIGVNICAGKYFSYTN